MIEHDPVLVARINAQGAAASGNSDEVCEMARLVLRILSGADVDFSSLSPALVEFLAVQAVLVHDNILGRENTKPYCVALIALLWGVQSTDTPLRIFRAGEAARGPR